MQKGEIYRRGAFWLDHARGADGRLASPNLYVCWYDAGRGRQRRKSTRTADVQRASEALDAHYLAVHIPDDADRRTYTVVAALSDYYAEVGSERASASSIRARLLLLTRFLDAETTAGRLPDPLLPIHLEDGAVVKRFRKWAVADPIVALRKDGAGQWVRDGASRKRSPATAEESVIALKAAMNHAAGRRRIAVAPRIHHLGRDEVTPVRHDRLSLAALGELLDWSARGSGRKGHGALLLPFRRYLIGAVCTIGRPDALLDLSVAPVRKQWLREVDRIDLNHAGRIQTKKYRPVLPVAGVMRDWLCSTDEWFVCREALRTDPGAGEAQVVQSGVRSVRSAWDSARLALGLPAGWGVKLLRHSVATLLANRRVNPIELQIALGHQVLEPTTRRYVIFAPEYLSSFLAGVEDLLSDLAPICGGALAPPSRRSSRKGAEADG